jgi:hypothetical protein
MVCPRNKTVSRRNLYHGVSGNFGREEKQLPLQRTAAGAQEKIGDSQSHQNAMT